MQLVQLLQYLNCMLQAIVAVLDTNSLMHGLVHLEALIAEQQSGRPEICFGCFWLV